MVGKREEVRPSSSEIPTDAKEEASSVSDCDKVTSPMSREGESTARGDDVETKEARGEIRLQITEDEETQEKKSLVTYLSSLKESLLYPLPPPIPLSSSSPLIATPYKVPVSLILRGLLPHPPTSPSPCFSSSCFSSSSSTSSTSSSSHLSSVTSSGSPRSRLPPVPPSSPPHASPCDTPSPQPFSAAPSPSSSSSSFVPIPPSLALHFEENREHDELQQTVFERLYANRDAAWCRRYFLKYQNDFDVSLKTLNRLSVLLPLPILKKLVVFHSRIKKVWPLPILAWMSSSSRTLAMRTWGIELDTLERRGGVPPDSPGPSQGVVRRTGGGRFAGGTGSSQQRKKVLGCVKSDGHHTTGPPASSTSTHSSATSCGGGGGAGDGVHTAVGSASGYRGGKTKPGERKKRKSQKKKCFSLGQQRKSQISARGGITTMSLRSSQVEEGGGGDGDEGPEEVAEEGSVEPRVAEDRGDEDRVVDRAELDETPCPDVLEDKEVKGELKGLPGETEQREGEEEGERTGEARKVDKGEKQEDDEKSKATAVHQDSHQNKTKTNDENVVESSVGRPVDQSLTSAQSKEAEERRSKTDGREEAKSVGETKSEEIMMISQGEDKRKDDADGSSPVTAGGTSSSHQGVSTWIGEGNLEKVVVKIETDQGEEVEEEKKKNKGEDDEDGDDQSGDEREASRDTDDEKWQRQGFAGKREAEVCYDGEQRNTDRAEGVSLASCLDHVGGVDMYIYV